MKPLLYLFVLLAFAAVDSPASSPAPAQEMLWPLPVDPPAITGTFMEFRQGRFHSGMDLRTQGREGLPVVAPAAGSIVRLRTAPTGYGVAVYLKLDDGRMLVFGHLSVLSDRLREPILRAWQKTGRYKQYLYLKPDELRVERGELLALSGSTGVGAPHLHLEVRDANERPMNPQLNGFAVPDTVTPKITEIRMVPLGAGAHVDGERTAKNFEPGASFSAAGTLGVMVRIDDRTGYSPFRVGPLGVAVEVDGEEVYRLENEVFAFKQTGQMRLEKFVDPENHKKSWLRLYRRPGNELPDRVATGPEGATFVAREGEEHRLTIRAWDVGGQSGESFWAVSGGPLLPWEMEENPGLRLVLPKRYQQEGGPYSAKGGVDPTRPKRWRVERKFTSLPTIDFTRWIVREGSFYFGGALGGHRHYEILEPPPGTSEFKNSASMLVGDGLVPRDGWEYEVHGRGWGPNYETVGLFVRDLQGQWSFVGPMSEEEGVWRGVLREFGEPALARDTTSPELGPFRVGKRLLSEGETLRPVTREQQQGVTLPYWPAVRITLKDLAAGIPADGLETLLDGKPYPARWEPEDQVLVYEWWLDPGEGEHQLTVKARDGLGNASEASIRLSFQR